MNLLSFFRNDSEIQNDPWKIYLTRLQFITLVLSTLSTGCRDDEPDSHKAKPCPSYEDGRKMLIDKLTPVFWVETEQKIHSLQNIEDFEYYKKIWPLFEKLLNISVNDLKISTIGCNSLPIKILPASLDEYSQITKIYKKEWADSYIIHWGDIHFIIMKIKRLDWTIVISPNDISIFTHEIVHFLTKSTQEIFSMLIDSICKIGVSLALKDSNELEDYLILLLDAMRFDLQLSLEQDTSNLHYKSFQWWSVQLLNWFKKYSFNLSNLHCFFQELRALPLKNFPEDLSNNSWLTFWWRTQKNVISGTQRLTYSEVIWYFEHLFSILLLPGILETIPNLSSSRTEIERVFNRVLGYYMNP